MGVGKEEEEVGVGRVDVRVFYLAEHLLEVFYDCVDAVETSDFYETGTHQFVECL